MARPTMSMTVAEAADVELPDYRHLREAWETIELPREVPQADPDTNTDLGLLVLFLRTWNFKANPQRAVPVDRHGGTGGSIRTWPGLVERLNHALPHDPPGGRDDYEARVVALDEILGVGPALASALLHFRYPGSCPILDYRVVQGLYRWRDSLGIDDVPSSWQDIESGRLTSEVCGQAREYLLQIRGALLELGEDLSLRKVERALWRAHQSLGDHQDLVIRLTE